MKHAWLIIAHNNFEILEKLLKYFDHECNNIYLHLDKKVKCYKVPENICKKANLCVVPNPVNVMWGGSSQIECEMKLLEIALKDKNDYYHLISGVDVPLQKFSALENFFQIHKGKEFVGFVDGEIDPKLYLDRVGVHHYFQNSIGKRDKFIGKVLNKLQNMIIKLELIFGIDRNKKNNFLLSYGPNWFSITDDFAKYVVSQKKFISKRFKFSFCADEIFLQTLMVNSTFKNKNYSIENKENQILRHIDWDRGNPYTFGLEDYELLKNLPKEFFFARKFDYQKSPEIVEKLFKDVL